MAKTWLKEGHSLIGKDVLPVVLRLRESEMINFKLEEMASFSKKYELKSYAPEDLRSEIKLTTGVRSKSE